MNSLFVVALGFGLIILVAAIAYLVYLKRQNRLRRENLARQAIANRKAQVEQLYTK
ncbi:hypothetical protein GALL_213120 [mine drainage metagenome]|uniref:Uncharacterized protein n=1 Tax=mine drainage metagenome TaxID=410659 RepID=A0A1J5RXD3_9ZZZZ